MRTRGSIDITLEELGSGDKWLDVTVEFTAYPEEPRVLYERDGSGYPGAPAYAEIDSVRVTRFGSVNGLAVRRTNGMFALLDIIARKRIDELWQDVYEEMCFESLAMGVER